MSQSATLSVLHEPAGDRAHELAHVVGAADEGAEVDEFAQDLVAVFDLLEEGRVLDRVAGGQRRAPGSGRCAPGSRAGR